MNLNDSQAANSIQTSNIPNLQLKLSNIKFGDISNNSSEQWKKSEFMKKLARTAKKNMEQISLH